MLIIITIILILSFVGLLRIWSILLKESKIEGRIYYEKKVDAKYKPRYYVSKGDVDITNFKTINHKGCELHVPVK